MNNNFNEPEAKKRSFTEAVEALVEEYKGTGYIVILATPDGVGARSNADGHQSALVLYKHINIVRRKMEDNFIAGVDIDLDPFDKEKLMG